MAIDSSVVGRSLPPLVVEVERGRLRAFATAIGESDPRYIDTEAAREAGHRDLPVPPTFLFGLELERPKPFEWLSELGVDLARVLHGEESFEYHTMAYAGDTLLLESRIVSVYSKKGGLLDFIDRETRVTRAGEPVATLNQTLVVRTKEVSA